MAAIALPEKPSLRGGRPKFLDWGGRLVPILGGPVQPILRLGSRFAMDFTLPRMPSEPYGRTWAASLIQGKLQGVIVSFLQDGFSTGHPGTPVVNGSGQTGTSLAIHGVYPGYRFRYGQFFNVYHAGRYYLHMITDQLVIVGPDGTATLNFLPMLRIIASDADPVIVAVPKIQGSLVGDETAWDVGLEPFTDLGTIKIEEDA
jgi:hypothetical protein